MPTPLVDLRRQVGLTQKALARKAGVGERTIREIEDHHHARFQWRIMGKIAQALEVVPQDIEEFALLYPAPRAEGHTPRPLREWRHLANLSLMELFGLCEVPQMNINLIERHMPVKYSVEDASAIAEALGIDPSEISEFEIRREPGPQAAE